MSETFSSTAEAPDPRDTHQTVRTVSLGTLWRALRYPFILLSFALIPRLMGDEDYGRYAYFVSVFVLLDMLTDLGFLQVFGRFVPECDASHDSGRLRSLFYGLLIYGVALSALAVVGASVVNALRSAGRWPWGQVAFLAALLILTRVEGTFFSLLYGLNQIARFSAKEMIRSAATLVLVLWLYTVYGLPGAFWGLVLNEVILTGAGAWWIRDYLWPPVGRVGWSALKPYALFGVKFYIPALLFGMLQRMGNIFAKWWTGSDAQVAYYDIANQYLLLTATFLGLIVQTLLPALTRLHLQSDEATARRWQRAALTYCAMAAFLAFNALMWLGDLFIRRWLGESFAPTWPNAKIMTLAMAPVLLAYAGMNLALIRKSARVYLAGVAAGMLVMTIASAATIPAMGSKGAAWATVAGYSALALVFVARYWSEFRHIAGGLTAAVLVGACFYPFYTQPRSLLVGVALFVFTSALYVGLLFLLRIAKLSDVGKLWVAFRSGKS